MEDVVTVEAQASDHRVAARDEERSVQDGPDDEELSAPSSEVSVDAVPEIATDEPEAAPSIAAAPRPRARPASRPKPQPQLADEELWEEPPAQPEPRVKAPSSPAPPGELPQRRVVVIDENSEIDIQGSREAPPPAMSEIPEGMADIGATLDDERGQKRRWRMFRKGGD
jgi:hypothetical protein